MRICKYLRLLNCSDVVTLLIGPTEVKLSCHKALLGFTSEFSDAALYGHFEEGQVSKSYPF